MVFSRSSASRSAAVGVRVVALGQFLVARLHRVQRGRPGQAERGQRLAQLGRRLRSAAGAWPRLHPAGGQHVQRVAQHLLVPGGGAAEAAERPGRALPGGVGAKLRLDLAGRHAFVVVPGAVVGAHMLQAEPPVVVQVPPRLGRAVFARRARSRACRRSGPARPGRARRPWVAWARRVMVRVMCDAAAGLATGGLAKPSAIGRYVGDMQSRAAPAAQPHPDRGILADAAARRWTTARVTPAMPARSRAGETHYSVLLVSRRRSRGMSRVARSRAVHAALAAEFAGGHARAGADAAHAGGAPEGGVTSHTWHCGSCKASPSP